MAQETLQHKNPESLMERKIKFFYIKGCTEYVKLHFKLLCIVFQICTASQFSQCFSFWINGANRFVFISNTKTWKAAQSYCRQYYTDLVIIQNQTEKNQLNVLMSPYASAWIGLFRDVWKWSDATNVSSVSFTRLHLQSGLHSPCEQFSLKEQITDDSRLFQDAVSSVSFWMRSFPLLCRRPRSLSSVSGPAAC
uniref:C-type lectin domain-containing protein n=1 Tax=Sinocyclocheilus rhinocerous TaxID=307959 RepID=A0A673GCU2_9TELE